MTTPAPDTGTHPEAGQAAGAAVLEVQHGRFEIGEVESATYFVTIGR